MYSKSNVIGSNLSELMKNARENGYKYLQILRDFLHSNIADYPTYSASDAYDSDNTGSVRDNDTKKTFWT